MQRAEFKRSDGVLVAGMGVLLILAACVGVVMLALLAQSYDLESVALIVFGFGGACALGVGLINAWRTPMLTIKPDVLRVPTFFTAREIPIKAGYPVGEFLASSSRGRTRPSSIEGNKFVHFYTLDAAGVLTELLALHRAAPEVGRIRRAFQDVAGMTVETLKADSSSKLARPDVTHWTIR